jgi:hypothetical protein
MWCLDAQDCCDAKTDRHLSRFAVSYRGALRFGHDTNAIG